jgi:hypothetical protein
MPNLKRLVSSVALAALVAVAHAQSPTENPPGRQLRRTWGELNGRAWRLLSEESKLAYLEGVTAGNSAAITRALNSPNTSCLDNEKRLLDVYRMVGFTQAEKMQGIDRLYDEPENLLMPIADALEIVSAKARGVPQDALEARILQFRRAANEAPEWK